MRQQHVAGDKLFIDYSGKKPCYFDPTTGARIQCELFVAVLGASSLTYAEATASQRREDFLRSHLRAHAYFGGVPRLWVPDNLKSAVTKACRYEPTLQRDYEELAAHMGAAVLPARPYKPRGRVERWRGGVRLRGVACFGSAQSQQGKLFGKEKPAQAQAASAGADTGARARLRSCARRCARSMRACSKRRSRSAQICADRPFMKSSGAM